MASKASTTTAPAAPAGLTFSEGSIPEATRVLRPNPFSEVVEDLAANKAGTETAKSVTFTVAADKVESNLRLAQAAGRREGVTIRKMLNASEDGKTVAVTIWAVDKITRPRDNA